MKALLLIRHAKSSWDTPSQKDFDRPLNDRGHHDAYAMAERLLDKGIKIDAFISSTANRALSTARYFAKKYNVSEHDIIKASELYEAPFDVFYDVIRKVDNKFDSIAIFAHNPGITAFANDLTKTRIDNMPTCGIFAIQTNIKNWKDFEDATKTFWFVDYPKLKE
ncbi:histidine phosphatase family protein [Panacibacter ginsenosidivorans]|uniref:Histidine phosphatase family protein n=1 Tax=Panacibacter ginsenosidivorans TaxID=1813871 RepID=A0A5B8V9U0_9BACT|nr:histidine phosphatase family protein [Panacibacter ginsenosidivorans]QEC67486.1 histidine phosphatase family protein [Panacibacter ginsenosidivorans]